MTGWATDRRRRWPGALLVALSLLASACVDGLPFVGGDDARYLDAGRELIEGDLANRIGLGPLAVVCQGRDLGPGDTFGCTAVPDGQPSIEFVATISDDGEGVDLASTNLLLAEQVERIEAFAAALIAEDTSRPITAAEFECADSSLVVAMGEALDCLVTDPTDGVIHTVAVTVDDLATLSVTVDVGQAVG